MATNPDIPMDQRLTDEQRDLAASCTRLVAKIAKDRAGRYDDLDEMIRAGHEGLIRAAQTYDPSKSSFVTHARIHIISWILKHHRTKQVHQSRYTTGLNMDLICGRPEPRGDGGIDPEIVARAMNSLPVRLRELVVGRIWHGGTLKEVGVRLGCNKERVRQLQVGAFDRLRNALPQYAKGA